jgi:LmbE family N-acetylglucosaminyl deacetylase
MPTILTIIAHPDDETMLSGGALALLARAGAEVYYLCATRGEGGEAGEPARCTRETLGAVREAEMRCAVQALGGAGVEFLNYVDPLAGENDVLHPYTNDFDGLVAKIREQLQVWKPEVVISHGSSGEYGHPAHVLTHIAARKAVEEMGEKAPVLYTFSAAFPEHPRPRLTNQDDPADIVLDISPVLQQKVDAALCHETQHALFVRRSSVRAGRQLSVPEVVMTVEGLHRVYPASNGHAEDVLMELLKPWITLQS